jgi:hypothetical protein
MTGVFVSPAQAEPPVRALALLIESLRDGGGGPGMERPGI